MFKNLFITLVMLTSASSVSAATIIWEPDVPFNFTVDTINTSGLNLGLFDDTDTLSDSNALNLTGLAAEVSFADIGGGNWSVTNLATSITKTLVGGNQFVLALTDGLGAWFEAVNAVQLSANSSNNQVTFSNGEENVYVIDAIPTVVPVPAAAWLFGAGLLGLVGVARRKKA